MNAPVVKVIGMWRGVDGNTAEVTYEGDDAGGLESWIAVKSLPEPRINYGTEIELKGGARVSLPTNEIAHILPDKSGVLVLFDEGTSLQDNCMAFSAPGNAAIFNSDGSLRFRLKNPEGEDGHFRAVVPLSLAYGSAGIGVRACSKLYPACESAYVVNGSTDDLSNQIPHWVRD